MTQAVILHRSSSYLLFNVGILSPDKRKLLPAGELFYVPFAAHRLVFLCQSSRSRQAQQVRVRGCISRRALFYAPGCAYRGRLSSRYTANRRRSGECMCSSTPHLPDVFLKLRARTHDLVSAAAAAQTKISPYAQHSPVLAAAGVRLFHCEYVSNLNIHASPYFLISSQ